MSIDRISKIKKRLSSRDDVQLFDNPDFPIFGISRRVYEVTRHWRESPWQPYSKTTSDIIAQGFAMDVWPVNDKPTKAQKERIEAAESFGILFAWVKKGDEDLALLGAPSMS